VIIGSGLKGRQIFTYAHSCHRDRMLLPLQWPLLQCYCSCSRPMVQMQLASSMYC
jgi:hypothetical protein